MTEFADLLQAAQDCQRQGDLSQAERLCRAALQMAPDHADTWFCLAEIAARQNRLTEAVDAYGHGVNLLRQRDGIWAEVSPGELLDKITILQIKEQRLTEPDKLAHVRRDLASLMAVRAAAIVASRKLDELVEQLRAVNERLWQIEDEIRLCEQQQDFGPRFVALARSVYQQNDRRAEIKRQINLLTNARFHEQKSYAGVREKGSDSLI